MEQDTDYITIQPDYKKWEQVKIGMTFDEVTKTLGEPPPSLGFHPETEKEIKKAKRLSLGGVI